MHVCHISEGTLHKMINDDTHDGACPLKLPVKKHKDNILHKTTITRKSNLLNVLYTGSRNVYLEDMRAKLVRYAQDKVMVPIGVPTTPTRTDWNPAERHEEYEQIHSSPCPLLVF